VNDLVAVLFLAHNLPAAKQLYERALAGRETVLGAKHPDTLTTLNNLAVLADDCGEDESAAELFVRVLPARTEVLGIDHADTIDSACGLRTAMQKRGKHDKAESAYL